MRDFLRLILIGMILTAGYYFFIINVEGVKIPITAVNDSGVSGYAMLIDKNGELTVKLNLSGGGNGVPMPAHIHAGECPGVGPVRHALNSVIAGNSTTILSAVKIEDLKATMPLAINIHKSADQISQYVACGSLSLEQADLTKKSVS